MGSLMVVSLWPLNPIAFGDLVRQSIKAGSRSYRRLFNFRKPGSKKGKGRRRRSQYPLQGLSPVT